jgi:hypothetical protein
MHRSPFAPTLRTVAVYLGPGLALLAASLLGSACDNQGVPGGARDTTCDDGSQLVCAQVEPDCGAGAIAAIQNGCWECVDPDTCEAPAPQRCSHDSQCAADQWCNPCGASSCPMCTDCVAVCEAHGCETENEAQCEMVRPDCEGDQVSVVQDGCWVCVDRLSCEPARPTHCDDGTEPLCNMPAPECDEGEILAHQDQCYVCVDPDTCEPPRDDSCDDGTEPICAMVPPHCDDSEILAYQDQCFVCVNPQTCAPWGQPGCANDADCDPTDWCNPCGSSSCPMCDDCVPACQPHGCDTETELLCFGVRPDCDPGEVAIIEQGCWECVSRDSCQ